jgi:hypothetical protein
MTQTGLITFAAHRRVVRKAPIARTRQELVSLAKLLSDASAERAAALIRAMKEDA